MNDEIDVLAECGLPKDHRERAPLDVIDAWARAWTRLTQQPRESLSPSELREREVMLGIAAHVLGSHPPSPSCTELRPCGACEARLADEERRGRAEASSLAARLFPSFYYAKGDDLSAVVALRRAARLSMLAAIAILDAAEWGAASDRPREAFELSTGEPARVRPASEAPGDPGEVVLRSPPEENLASALDLTIDPRVRLEHRVGQTFGDLRELRRKGSR